MSDRASAIVMRRRWSGLQRRLVKRYAARVYDDDDNEEVARVRNEPRTEDNDIAGE